MQGYAIQEFNNCQLKAELSRFIPDPLDPVTSAESSAKNIAVWESPRLTTEYPIDGRPPGSDRGICRIVNGVMSVRFLDKDILRPENYLEITGSLCGEYAGISGVIQQIAFAERFSPLYSQMYISNGALAFPQLSSFANLMPNIFIRLVFRRSNNNDNPLPQNVVPLNVVISGSLLATNPK